MITFRKALVAKKNHTSHDQFNLTKLPCKTDSVNCTKERKFPSQDSPTQQVVQLTKNRPNFPSSNHSQNGSSVVLCSFLTIVAVVVSIVMRDAEKVREKSKSLSYIEPPVCQA